MKRRPVSALLFLLAACTSAMDLPPAPQAAAPVLARVRPLEGYYYDEVRIEGVGFDPEPGANEVTFGGDATARGTVDPATGELVVRVPFSTSSIEGPVEVTTRRGRSAPSRESFLHLGAGYPHVGSVLTEVPVRHAPAGLGADDEGPVFPSSALQALVHGRTGKVRLPAAAVSFAAAAGGGEYLVGYAAGSREGLSLVERSGWRIAARAPATDFSERHVAFGGAGGPVALAAGETRSDDAFVAAYRRDGAVLSRRERPLAVDRVLSLAAAPDGRHALLVVRAPGPRGLTTGVLRVDPEGEAPAEWLEAPPGPALAGPSVLATVGGEPRLVCAREDGSLVSLAVGGALGWSAAMEGEQDSAPGALAFAGGLVVASHRATGTLAGIDPASGKVAWRLAVRGAPEALGVAPGGARVLVADGASNDVDVVEASTGRWLERRGYPMGLGSADDCECGPVAPFRQLPGRLYSSSPRMLFASARWETVVVLEPNKFILERPLPLADGASPAQGLVEGPDETPWVLHERELGVLGDEGERLVVRELPATPTRLVFAAGRLVVGSARRVDVYAPDGDGWRHQGVFARPEGELVAGISAQPDGRVAVFWYGLDATGEELRGGLFSVDALATGGDADVAYPLPAGPEGFVGLVEMKTGTTLLFSAREAGGGPVSFPLGAALGPAGGLDSVIDALEPLLVTRNRQLVAWHDRLAGDNVLRMAAFWDGASWASYGEYRLPGPFARPATDPSGEWLYLPMVGDDRILILN